MTYTQWYIIGISSSPTHFHSELVLSNICLYWYSKYKSNKVRQTLSLSFDFAFAKKRIYTCVWNICGIFHRSGSPFLNEYDNQFCQSQICQRNHYLTRYWHLRLSTKDCSTNTFGWARAEVVGALINACFLFALCFSISVQAIKNYF